jgi:hypothetical protein
LQGHSVEKLIAKIHPNSLTPFTQFSFSGKIANEKKCLICLVSLDMDKARLFRVAQAISETLDKESKEKLLDGFLAGKSG